MIDSPEYRAWKEEAAWKIKTQLPRGFRPLNPTFEQQLVYRVKVYLPNKRTDAANYDKGVRDVLTNVGVWSDDKWALPTFDWVEIDSKNPRIEVTI